MFTGAVAVESRDEREFLESGVDTEQTLELQGTQSAQHEFVILLRHLEVAQLPAGRQAWVWAKRFIVPSGP